ncbi:hypothetical protein QT983_27795 [Microcoleus sp. Z1_B5]
MSDVDAVADDILFGDDSKKSVVSDDKGVWCSSGFEVVSAVAGNGVLSEAFSLVVDAVTTGNVLSESCSDFVEAVGDNCVLFSSN